MELYRLPLLSPPRAYCFSLLHEGCCRMRNEKANLLSTYLFMVISSSSSTLGSWWELRRWVRTALDYWTRCAQLWTWW